MLTLLPAESAEPELVNAAFTQRQDPKPRRNEMSWVLIIIVSFGVSRTTGGTVTNVPGYQSKQSCEQAAQETGKGHLADVHFTTVCIPGPEK